MRIEYNDKIESPKEYDYPVNGGNIERAEWEENHARCVAHRYYPVNGGKLERMAWERAHGWD